jgi:dipeptide transport system permease protein
MLKLIFRRIVGALPNLIGVVIITFVLTRALPGDPAAFFAGGAATQEAVEEVRRAMGLDQPLWSQFLRYLGDLAQGDLGVSLTTGQPVAQEILTRLPASFELVIVALVLACAIAIPLGVLAATRPGSWIDHCAGWWSRSACRCRCSSPVYCWSTSSTICSGWAPSPLGRLDPVFSPPPAVTGLLPDRQR